MFNKIKTKGFSLIELLVAITFISVIITVILTMNVFNSSLWKLNEDKTKAYLYATESLEAIKLINWSDLSNGDYHLVLENDAWDLVAGNELLENKYTRNINISDVKREFSSNGHVYGEMSASGFSDPDSKKITATITWPDKKGNIKTTSLESYISRWRADRLTQTDWSGGSGQSTWVDDAKFFSKTNSLDISIEGISTLVSGFLDWNQATPTSTLSLPSTYNANDVQVVGDYAYMVTDNNSSGSEFFIVNITDVKNPVQISSLNIGTSVTGVAIKDNYAYISTRGNSTELRVINITNKNSPSITTSLDLPDSNDALALDINETKLYIVQGNYLRSIDISTPSSPQILDDINLNGLGTEVFISANYVYIASQNASQEFQIIDATNPANLQNVGGFNLSGSMLATDVFVLGNRAYLATDNNSSAAEFFIFDLDNISDPVLLGSYEVGAKLYAINIIGPYALLATNLSNQELKIIDVSFPNTINQITNFDLSGYVLGIAANCSVIYTATTSDNAELTVLTTGVTDCGYASTAELESSTFDTGANQVTYNWISWAGTQPENTSIEFQIATSNNADGPWNFYGPDASGSSYYTIAAKEFINYNQHLNQRYLRYKLFLDSQANLQAPILEEVTISYSTYP